MDLPQPPADQDLRNIIDKLAQFVARNGPEFEHMTKTKQKDNPKFSFLFGGEFYHYYTYKVKISDDSGILKSQGLNFKKKLMMWDYVSDFINRIIDNRKNARHRKYQPSPRRVS